MESDVPKLHLLSWDEDGIIRIRFNRNKVLIEKLCFVVFLSCNFVCFAINSSPGKIFFLLALQTLENSLTIFSGEKFCFVVASVPFW